jgi:hypothetical protein
MASEAVWSEMAVKGLPLSDRSLTRRRRRLPKGTRGRRIRTVGPPSGKYAHETAAVISANLTNPGHHHPSNLIAEMWCCTVVRATSGGVGTIARNFVTHLCSLHFQKID